MKVLIVDDESALRKVLQELIETQGHSVVSAKDGVEGLQVFREQEPDLVFSDIRMPNMDGMEFLAKVREMGQTVIFVIITGLEDHDYTLKALRHHANDFLRKPIHPNVLLPLLEKYSGIVTARTRLHETLRLFVRRSFVIQFENHLEKIPEIVERLIAETYETIPVSEKLGTKIGLVELIANAMEHGNLEITFEEKQAAMNLGLEGIDRLREERAGNPELAKRIVTVEFSMDRHSCEWIIGDEGAGFDWGSLPNPLNPENLSQPSGRGIFLARMHFNDVEFLGRGNRVRAKKSFIPPLPDK